MTLAVFGAACALALGGLASFRTQALAAGGNPFDQTPHPVGIGARLPDARCLDQSGRSVSIAQFRGRTLIIGFIYTNCADECPLLTSKFGQLVKRLPSDRFELLEISIAPRRDDRAAIARFAAAHNITAPNWLILTGKPELVQTFAAPLGVSVVAGSNGELLHSERTVVAGPDGRVALLIDTAAWTPGQVEAAARHVDGLPSSALARVDLALGKAVQDVCGGAGQGAAGLRGLIGILAVVLVGALAAFVIARRIFSQNS
jgi:cytochrome oxidase Cu insertion factor (SCO1/SenC/PrrC family)